MAEFSFRQILHDAFHAELTTVQQIIQMSLKDDRARGFGQAHHALFAFQMSKVRCAASILLGVARRILTAEKLERRYLCPAVAHPLFRPGSLRAGHQIGCSWMLSHPGIGTKSWLGSGSEIRVARAPCMPGAADDPMMVTEAVFF